jgi:thiosulfate/3-mercaptopyruvate sulfurtransferase
MRLFRNITWSLAAMLLSASDALYADGPRDSMIVSTAWLVQHLNDQDLVLLHVGDKAEYEAKHIPGARLVSPADLSVSDRSGKGLVLEMPPAEDLRTRLAALGISDASRVVVYYGKDLVAPTTRVIFTLDYAGLGERTSLLDGGMNAWIGAGQTVTNVVPEPRTGTLSPLKVRPLIVNGDYVRAQLGKPGVAIVDSRANALYEGMTTGGSKEMPHKTGHIAGAVSVPFTAITDQQLNVRSPEALEAIFKGAGIKPGDTVITYCHIGQQATATLFAARSLGYKVLLYDGSFEDWSRRADGPVDNPGK